MMNKHSVLIFLCLLLSGFSISYAQNSQQRWILSLKADSLDTQLMNGEGVNIEKTIRGSSMIVVSIKDSLSLSGQRNLFHDPSIFYAEPDCQYEASIVPNDSDFHLLWALNNTGQNGGIPEADIQLTEAWQKETGSDSVVVGVIDSGVDWRHPDLIDNIWQNLAEDADQDGRVLEWIGGQWVFDPGDQNGIDDDGNGYIDDFVGWDFVNNDNDPSDDHFLGHGTHVAGTIAARGNNGLGISGVSWHAKIMALKFLNGQGTGFASDAVAAIDYAIMMEADLTNNSWGGGINSQSLFDAVGRAQQAGQIFVAAAGNNYGNNNDRTAVYPSSYAFDNILSVTATDNYDRLTNFANIGHATVDLAAPGYGIYSTTPQNRYGYLSGTSMAAPHVSGAICLLLSQQATAAYTHIIDRLIYAVDRRNNLEEICTSGGRLNVHRAMGPPFLFQAEIQTTGLTHALAAGTLGEGKTIMSGLKNDSVFLSVISPAGRMLHNNSLNLPEPDTSHLLRKMFDGQLFGSSFRSSNADIYLQYMDSSLQPIWEQVLGGNGADQLHSILTSPEGNIWVIGRTESFAGSNSALYIAQLDSSGHINWERRFNLDMENLQSTFTASGEIIILGQLSGGMPGLLTIKSDGSLLWARSYASSDVDHPQDLAMGIAEVDGEELLLFAGWDGQQSIWTIWLDPEDGEVSQALSIQHPDFTAPVQMMVRNQQWVIACGSKNKDGMYSWISNSDGDILRSRKYNAAQGTLIFRELITNSSGGFSLLGLQDSSHDSSIFWGQLDRNAHASCGETEIVLNQIPLNDPIESLLSGISSSLVTSTASLPSVSQTSFSLASVILCDNSSCQTLAFFRPDAWEICEDVDVSLTNLSSQANSYEWRANGVLFSTNTHAVFSPQDDGAYDISLTAINGTCKDEIHRTITVDPELLPFIPDTSHCGNAITLQSNVEAVHYQWLDDNEQVIGTERQQRFTLSGIYELELTDICGNSESVSFTIDLQDGCMWPGDVNADGTVDILDFLMLGLVDGTVGMPRTNPSTVYAAQASADWLTTFPVSNPWAPGINIKHADSNGDGVVEIAKDGQIIRQNATAPGILPPDSSNSSISLTASASQQVLEPGDSLSFTFFLEDPLGGNINQLYGVAFSLFYNLPIEVDPALSIENSFMNGVNDTAHTLGIPYPAQNRFDIGITRTNLINVDGAGVLMAMCCITVVIDDIADFGANADQIFLSLSIQNAFLISNDGSRIPIGSIESQGLESILIRMPSDSGSQTSVLPPLIHWSDIRLIKVYPNPAHEQINIEWTASQRGHMTFELYTLTGQAVLREEVSFLAGDQHHVLNLADTSPGLYILRGSSKAEPVFFHKVMIQ